MPCCFIFPYCSFEATRGNIQVLYLSILAQTSICIFLQDSFVFLLFSLVNKSLASSSWHPSSLEIPFHVMSRFPFSYIKTLKLDEMNGRALASGQVVQIHPTSVLHQSKVECVIFDELVQTSQKYIRNTTRIDYLWLTELAPHYYAMQG